MISEQREINFKMPNIQTLKRFIFEITVKKITEFTRSVAISSPYA